MSVENNEPLIHQLIALETQLQAANDDAARLAEALEFMAGGYTNPRGHAPGVSARKSLELHAERLGGKVLLALREGENK